MSVVTQADEDLKQIKRDIDSVAKRLSGVIIDKPWGWDQYSDLFHLDAIRWLNQLLTVQAEMEARNL